MLKLKILSRLLIFFMFLFTISSLSSCVSKAKYNDILIEQEKISRAYNRSQEKNIELQKNNKELEYTIDELEKTIKKSYNDNASSQERIERYRENEKKLQRRIQDLQEELIILSKNTRSSLTSLKYDLFTYPENCIGQFSIDDMLGVVGSLVETKLTSPPFNSSKIQNIRYNKTSRKIILLKEGRSSIITMNPRYETVIYFIDIYYNEDSRFIKINLNFLPLLSGAKNDEKYFVNSTSKLNSYRDALDNLITSTKKELIKSLICLQ